MNKLLFWAIVIGVGLVVWKMFSAKARDGAEAPGKRAARSRWGRRRPSEVETMLECEQCGVHVPASEALRDDGHAFCCPAHRDAWRER